MTKVIITLAGPYIKNTYGGIRRVDDSDILGEEAADNALFSGLLCPHYMARNIWTLHMWMGR